MRTSTSVFGPTPLFKRKQKVIQNSIEKKITFAGSVEIEWQQDRIYHLTAQMKTIWAVNLSNISLFIFVVVSDPMARIYMFHISRV